jgi:hypothetical protein
VGAGVTTLDDLVVPVTIFPDRRATTKQEIGVNVSELTELIRATAAPAKERLPLLKLATFGEVRSPTGTRCLRWDGNVKLVHGVELDYDGEEIAFDEAYRCLAQAEVPAILYTSPSHRPAAPRWRALFPFAGAMLPAGRRGMALRAGAILGIDLGPDSLTLSQSYHYGRVGRGEHFRIEAIQGDPIDIRHSPIQEDPRERVELIGEHRETTELSDYGRAALDSAARNIMEASNREQERTLNREGYTIGQAAGAGIVPVKLALEVLVLAAREIPDYDPSRPWREKEAERKIMRAFQQGWCRPRVRTRHRARVG